MADEGEAVVRTEAEEVHSDLIAVVEGSTNLVTIISISKLLRTTITRMLSATQPKQQLRTSE